MERRTYSRLTVDIPGTLIKNNQEIPINIYNICENGIGFRYKFKDCPDNFTFKKNEVFEITFYDESNNEINVIKDSQRVQICKFEVKQIRKHSTHAYIGGVLKSSDNEYANYVLNKKTNRFINRIRYSQIGQLNYAKN